MKVFRPSAHHTEEVGMRKKGLAMPHLYLYDEVLQQQNQRVGNLVPLIIGGGKKGRGSGRGRSRDFLYRV